MNLISESKTTDILANSIIPRHSIQFSPYVNCVCCSNNQKPLTPIIARTRILVPPTLPSLAHNLHSVLPFTASTTASITIATNRHETTQVTECSTSQSASQYMINLYQYKCCSLARFSTSCLF